MIGSKQRGKITFNREFLFRNFHAEKSRHGTDKKKGKIKERCAY